MRQLQVLTDKLLELKHIISRNIEVGLHIRGLAERIRTVSSVIGSTGVYREINADISIFLFQHNTHKARIETMIERSQGVTLLVGLLYAHCVDRC